MRRRSLLTVVASLGAAPLAGCSGDRDPSSGATVTVERTTGTTTEITEASSTPRPGTVPTDRVVTGEATSADSLGVTADRWFGLESVRYDDGDERRTATTDRGWFVAYEFTIHNLGESRTGALPDAEFKLRVDGETYEHIHEFPGGVPFDAVDQPDVEPRIRELAWYDGLDAGESVSLQLVYEAPIRLDVRHYLAWHHGEPVEGSTDPVYLLGDRTAVDS